MSFLNKLSGDKPRVPQLPVTTLSQSQQDAISANKASAPGASEFANLTEDEINSLMNQAMPGFDGIRDKTSANIKDLLDGKIPDDVSGAVTRNSAARALGGGYAGSGMHGDLVARDLGLTSLNLMDKGINSAQSWIATSERLMSPAMANFQSMFVNPMQEYSTTNEQNVQQFQQKWLTNQIKAMPDPATRSTFDSVMQLSGRGQGAPNGSQYAQLGSPGDTKSASSGWRDSQGWGPEGDPQNPGGETSSANYATPDNNPDAGPWGGGSMGADDAAMMEMYATYM